MKTNTTNNSPRRAGVRQPPGPSRANRPPLELASGVHRACALPVKPRSARGVVNPRRKVGGGAAIAGTRAGFTLVEMLVAVGLVVLMMSLFASVFQIATSIMSKQKGFAENDQRARTLMILLKADLDKRTFRRVVPMGATVPATAVDVGPEASLEATQLGYFYYSENNPNDDTDDVLQFTINTSNVSKNTDTSPLYGRATFLRFPPPRGPATSGAGAVDDTKYLGQNQNQPEADDGQAVIDNASSSDSAEVVYFLRNRILYRRVMLIRKPLDPTTSIEPKDTPSSGTPLAWMDPTYAYVSSTNTVAPSPYSFISAGTGAFYADFDFSAYNDGTGVKFHGVNASQNALNNVPGANSSAALSTFLSNVLGSPVTPSACVATPNLRFGYSIINGRPREYATNPFVTGGSKFMGRFTHEETSHSTFTYPGVGPGTNSTTPPYANDPWNLTVDLNANGIATAYAGGPRRGEDILLTNVYTFDVKIFDDMQEIDRDGSGGAPSAKEDYNDNGVFDTVMDFRDLGYAAKKTSGKQGYYFSGANLNRAYGPLAASTVAAQSGADTKPGVTGVDDDDDGTTDNISELGWPGSDDVVNRVFDTWHSDVTGYLGSPPFRPGYRPNNASTPPIRWDFGPDSAPGRAGINDDNDALGNTDYLGMSGNADSGELGFPGSDDRHPVRAIKITIRYLDIPSNQMRNMTIVQSLTD